MVLVFLARYTWPKIIRISRCLKTGCNNVVIAEVLNRQVIWVDLHKL